MRRTSDGPAEVRVRAVAVAPGKTCAGGGGGGCGGGGEGGGGGVYCQGSGKACSSMLQRLLDGLVSRELVMACHGIQHPASSMYCVASPCEPRRSVSSGAAIAAVLTIDELLAVEDGWEREYKHECWCRVPAAYPHTPTVILPWRLPRGAAYSSSSSADKKAFPCNGVRNGQRFSW